MRTGLEFYLCLNIKRMMPTPLLGKKTPASGTSAATKIARVLTSMKQVFETIFFHKYHYAFYIV